MNDIKAIINHWDPIGLFPYAPEDEYDCEIKEIICFFNEFDRVGDISEYDLGRKIKKIFSDSFGNDVFCGSDEDCLKVAREILR